MAQHPRHRRRGPPRPVRLHRRLRPPHPRRPAARQLRADANSRRELQARGIWLVSREDPEYPESLSRRLGDQAPPVLFGAGETAILAGKRLGIVGARDADAASLDFTQRVAAWAVEGGLAVVSGAARGVDAVAMRAAFDAGGKVIGAVADNLEERIRDAETRRAVADGQAVLLSPYGYSFLSRRSNGPEQADLLPF